MGDIDQKPAQIAKICLFWAPGIAYLIVQTPKVALYVLIRTEQTV